jgi:hypothetical protein
MNKKLIKQISRAIAQDWTQQKAEGNEEIFETRLPKKARA